MPPSGRSRTSTPGGRTLTAVRDAGDGLIFKSITAYRSVEALGFRDGDNSPHVIAQTQDTWDHEQLSQEFQIGGTAASDALDWILGLYYFEEEGTNLNFVDFAPIFIQSGGSVDNDSWAAFGQATWRFTDRWSLTGGLRYTDETKRFTPDQFVIEDRGTGLPPGFPLLPSVEAETTITEFTPMVNLAYRWSDDAMTYLTYSEGFKSGGFTQRVFPPLPAVPSFEPEFASSWEIGAKLSALDDRLHLNGAAFFTDYDDLQVLVLLGVAPITQNAAAAEIKGFELELAARPTEAFLLEAGVGYTDAEYTEIGAQVIGLTPDKEFAQIPEWTVNAGASYDFTLGAGAILRPRVNWSYRSAVYMDALNTPAIRQSAYDLRERLAHLPDRRRALAGHAVGHESHRRAILHVGLRRPARVGHCRGRRGAPARVGILCAVPLLTVVNEPPAQDRRDAAGSSARHRAR